MSSYYIPVRSIIISVLMGASTLLSNQNLAAIPVDNPAAGYDLAWTDSLAWSNVVNVHDFEGADWLQRLNAAMDSLPNGGVVFFPSGVYKFEDDIVLRDGIILRGASPENITDAHDPQYKLKTVFEFPAFKSGIEQEDAPVDSRFRLIRTAKPATDSNIGLVNIATGYATILFADDEDRRAGTNRLVFGCIIEHALKLDPAVPDKDIGQHPWQRYMLRHHGAINIYSEENTLVANNRLPESDKCFRMPGYIVSSREGPVPFDVLFDFNNRSGIRVNVYSIGGAGTRDPHGTPETHPYGFRKGTVIRDNYIYHTGRAAIALSGYEARVINNVSRMKPNFQRFTHTGRNRSYGHSTNGNRALMMRGWGNHIEGNDYTVYQNISADGVYPINCGEGLMHEGHANSTIRNLTFINNTGNAYLSLYMTAGIDGLHIEGNDIRTSGGISAIYVRSDRTWDRHPVRNVSIINNITGGSGIYIAGEPSENNIIRGNRHADEEPGGITIVAEDVIVEDNINYTVQHREQRLRN